MLQSVIIKLIKLYQSKISCYTRPRCKFYPTCSNYAIESIMRFGAIKGGLLAGYRLLRCNPFSKGGYDPVPDKKVNG